MSLNRVVVNGKPMLPLWKVQKVKGWKCELVIGTNSFCISCAPRKGVSA